MCGQRKNSNENQPHASTYSSADHKLATERISNVNGSYESLLVKNLTYTILDATTCLKVRLPRFRNTVNIFADNASQRGLIATVRLDKAGFGNNLQRRLGQDYTELHVKGGKLNRPY